jgi:3-methyladenine DNA glycosylase/8-oxoguanine DNA glycosylase
MVEIVVKPRGPYSLALSARCASDATRRFRDGVFTALYRGELAHARQSPDGTLTIRADSEPAAEKLRWVLAVDDDHSEFLRRFRDDPLIGRATVHLRGLRPVRTATVAQALLRAVCGQLIDSKTARAHERRIIKASQNCGPVPGTGLCEPPQTSTFAGMAPFDLRRLGLGERRGAALVRLCRSIELERLHDVPTKTVLARIERERGLGPWSAGVVCLEGLGRYDHGLVGDLGLVKFLRAVRGRHEIETWETAELLEPYGEWAGLASVYLLQGMSRGLVPAAAATAA